MNRLTFIRAKDNPFTVQRVTAVPYRFESGDWESNLSKLKSLNYRAVILGPQGSGKSTLLRDLCDQLKRREKTVHYFLLPHEKSHQRVLVQNCFDLPDQSIVLIDGIERLPRWQRIRIFCRMPRLVVTAHSRSPIPILRLPVWIQARPSVESVRYVLEKIDRYDTDTYCHAKKLFRIHAGNIRNVMRDLYDRDGGRTTELPEQF